MKSRLVLILILVLALLCVPCLVSLAEGEDDSSGGETPSISSSETETESSAGSESTASDGSEDGSESTASDGSEDSSESSQEPDGSSSSSSESSSSGSGFKGDPVKGKTPKFADLELGSGDPDDGKDFNLKPEDNDGMAEVVIRNTEAKGMKGNDNFHIDFDGCELWLPIEIPASCVEDDHINSKLVISYGAVDEDVLDRVASSIQSSHMLQVFTLALTSYDIKGQSADLNSFDGRIKFVYGVNAACVNQYNRDGKLALLAYNTETRSLNHVDYEMDATNGEITVYASCSGSFFLINSNDIDLSAPIKLNTNAPLLKVLLYLGTFASIAASVALIALLIVKGKKQKAANAKR